MNKKALLIIVGGLVLIAAIIYFVFFYDFNKSTTNNTTTQQNQPAQQVVSTSSPAVKTGTPLSPEEASQELANKLAASFAERYGTSSSQADFSNLVDAEVFMTDSFKKETDAYIAKERLKSNDGAYESIMTSAALVDFIKFDDKAGTAEGLVKTRRRQTTKDGQTTSFNQDLSISLKKSGANWLVDSAIWK